MTDRTADDINFLIEQDRKRVQSILSLPEARGREKLAQVLALNANMSVDAARAALDCAPLPGSVAAAPEPEPTEQELFDWGAAAALALRGARRIRSRTSTNAEDDESEDGAAAARRLLGKEPLENEGDGSDLDDVAAKEKRGRDEGQPRPEPAAIWSPTPADMRAYAQGEAAARWAMQHGFGRPS
jgi:hypothetical protein